MQLLANQQSIRNSKVLPNLKKPDPHAGLFPVLTPIYLEEYMRKRGLIFKEVMSFEDEIEYVKLCISEGVRAIAICTTWLSGVGAADEVREAAQQLRKMAPRTPIIVGGPNVRKGLMVRELFAQGMVSGILPEWVMQNILSGLLFNGLIKKEFAQHFLMIDSKKDCCIDAMVTCEGGEKTLIFLPQKSLKPLMQI